MEYISQKVAAYGQFVLVTIHVDRSHIVCMRILGTELRIPRGVVQLSIPRVLESEKMIKHAILCYFH